MVLLCRRRFCCIGNEEKGILTTDWAQTISPSGESILTCKFDYAGITGEVFDGTLGETTTYPCNDVYPTFTCCQIVEYKSLWGMGGQDYIVG